MKLSQDMQLIQKLRHDQKRMKKVFEVMSGRNIVTNSRVTPSWREIVSLTFSEADVLHVNWTSFGHCVSHRVLLVGRGRAYDTNRLGCLLKVMISAVKDVDWMFVLLALFDMGQQTRLDLGWNYACSYYILNGLQRLKITCSCLNGIDEDLQNLAKVCDFSYGAQCLHLLSLEGVTWAKRYMKPTIRFPRRPSNLDAGMALHIILLISSEKIKEVMAEVKTKTTMKEFATSNKANYYSGITSITVNDKRAYELKGKFLDDLHNNAFSGTNREDAV
ncbi:hypothetical protein Tco_0304999 [Tanacetum coccineum]